MNGKYFLLIIFFIKNCFCDALSACPSTFQFVDINAYLRNEIRVTKIFFVYCFFRDKYSIIL